jgi:predicted transposase/invertase (TIGR01784 family)
MVYEARQAEIADQLTRIRSATLKGITQGEVQATQKLAKAMLIRGIPPEEVAAIAGLDHAQVVEIAKIDELE